MIRIKRNQCILLESIKNCNVLKCDADDILEFGLERENNEI